MSDNFVPMPEYPRCPICGSERVVRTSHTQRNPDRKFLTCPKGCEGSFKWVDALPKYDMVRPLDSRTVGQRETKAKELQTIDDILPATGKPSGVLDFLNIAPTAPKKELVWSEYQNKIYDFIEHGSGHAVVVARAGAAKTTTGMECLERIPSTASSAFVAFGVDIVETLRERHRGNSYINTTHAMCLENAKRAYPNLKVNKNKLWDIYESEIDRYGEFYEMKPAIIHLVNGLKATLRQPIASDLDYLVDRYGVEVNGDSERIYELTEKLYRLSMADHTEVDYEDMLHLTATGEVEGMKFDYLYADEFSDMTRAQTRALKNSLKPNGRILCLGDPMQAIFGFRFADTDAMDNAVAEYEATTLTLPISYRCAKSIVRRAQKFVPDIQARPDAPEGIVRDIPSLSGLRDGDTVLCRMNKYLVAGCFDLIRQGRKATILGRDIGNNLSSMLQRGEKKAGTKDLRAVLYALDSYVSGETAKYIRSHKEAQAASLQDRYDTLVALAERCKDLVEVKRLINSIFTKDKAGITFATFWKFKGNESDRVFIIEPQLLEPQKFDKQAWQLEELLHVNYVGITRAKSELYFVTG